MKEEALRARVLEVNPNGTGQRVFAAGLRQRVTRQEVVSGLKNGIRSRSRRLRATVTGFFVTGSTPVYHTHVATSGAVRV